MITSSTKGIYNHSIEKVWKISSKFDGISDWFSQVQKVVATGIDVDSKRTCSVLGPDGQTFDVVEHLMNLDNENHTMKIKVIQSPPPFEGLVADMTVEKLDENKTQVEWSYTFDPSSMEESTAKQMADLIFVTLRDDLGKYLDQTS